MPASSMASTVLEIEREAEKIIEQAEREAADLIAAARTEGEAVAARAKKAAEDEIGKIEARALEDRTMKAAELIAGGKASLSKVKNIPDASYERGVELVMRALAGK